MPLRFKGFAIELLVLLVYAIIAIGFTYPLVMHLTDHLPGVGTDPYQHLWFAWWNGRSVISMGISPFYCPIIFYPSGGHLNGEPLPFGLMFGILTRFLPEVLTFNFLYLFLYIFAAWGCYRLSLYLWNRRDVAFIAGLIFGFSPYMMTRGTGHINLLCAGFVPLAILGVIKTIDTDRFPFWKVLGAGILTAIVGLSSSYYFIFLAIWLVGLCLFLYFRGQLSKAVWRLAAIVGISLVVMLPQVLAIIKAISIGYYQGISSMGSAFMASIDLFGVLIPSHLHPLWGDWLERTFRSMAVGSIEKVAYPGLLIIFLAVLGWRHYRHHLWILWIGIWTVGAWILSLGPVLQILGRNTFLPLPGIAFVITPLLNNVRNPSRWVLLITLGFSLLASGGVKWLLEQGFLRRIRWMWVLVCALILFDFLPVPYPILPASIPVQSQRLPENSSHPVVLDIPLGRSDGFGGIGEFDSRSFLLQIAHQKPMVGGYLSRMRNEDKNFLQEGLLGNIIQVQQAASPKVPTSLRAEKIRTIIRRLANKNHLVVKVLQIVIGKEKMYQILNPLPVHQPPVIEPITPEQAMVQADRLGIGYVIAIDPSRPQVRAALDYVQNMLDLSLIGEEGKFIFYKVNYSTDHTPTEKQN